MAEFLIVVDMQNDFITGSLGTKEAIQIVESVRQKAEQFLGQVLFTRDTHTKDYLYTQEGRKLPVVHCLKGTQGWEIEASLNEFCRIKECRVFDKPSFGCVELAEYLKEQEKQEPIERIELVGLCSDICVINNAMLLKAYFPETELVVYKDLTAGVTTESHENALKAMEICQITVK